LLRFEQITREDASLYSTATLTFEQRVKSRQKVELDNGEAAGIFLPRGTVLLHGQRIIAQTGEVIEIRAASEAVSTFCVDDPVLMARACYHLGNRHVALQITENFARYQHDHVLDEMITGLGLSVVCEQAPFEPEAGAYDTGGHAHQHHAH
jgi:urease accessory protein